MDAFTAVMLAVELEKKKRAEYDALKSTQSDSPETIKPSVAPTSVCQNEKLRADPPKSEVVS